MKSIKSKLLLVFSLIFIPFVIVVIIAFITFSQMEDDGVAINLSGSQRMRTMLISNYAVQLYNKDETIGDLNFASETLDKEIQTYGKILKALVAGNSDFKIGINKDADIVKSINALDTKIISYIDKSKKVLDNSASDGDINYIISNALPIKNEINTIVSMYQSNYNNKVSSFKSTLIGLTVFGVLMLIFGYVFAKKIIVDPIKKVNDKLKEIASGDGDLTHVLEVTSNDEIGRLSDNFNKFVKTIRDMVVEISASSSNLEQVCDSLEIITEEVSIASEKLTSITSEIADGATDQANEVMSTAENLSELGEDIDEINNISEVMKTNSVDIQGINNLSQDSMTGLQGRNTESIQASNEINEAVNVLYNKIQRISEITQVISGISSQTNLLALNASIEAARAGEHGRGFSVVADEVGKLAEESTKSTVEISSIVTEIQVQVNFTKELMGKVLDITENQSHAVDKTKSDFNKVSVSLDDMIVKVNSVSARIVNVDSKKNRILDAIQNIASVSEETAASTEEVAAFADEFQASVNDISDNAKSLRASSSNLSNMIGQFKY